MGTEILVFISYAKLVIQGLDTVEGFAAIKCSFYDFNLQYTQHVGTDGQKNVLVFIFNAKFFATFKVHFF